MEHTKKQGASHRLLIATNRKGQSHFAPEKVKTVLLNTLILKHTLKHITEL